MLTGILGIALLSALTGHGPATQALAVSSIPNVGPSLSEVAMDTKKCPKCGAIRPMVGRCKVCVKQYQVEYRKTHKEERRRKGREYREKHIERILARDREYGRKNRAKRNKHQKEYYQATHAQRRSNAKDQYIVHREKRISYQLQAQRELRQETIAAYGGRCACCGEDHVEFLGIDHIDGKGAEHRRALGIKGGTPMYRWLRDHGYPKDNFQLLCHNCNQARGFYGYCPHEREKGKVRCLNRKVV